MHTARHRHTRARISNRDRCLITLKNLSRAPLRSVRCTLARRRRRRAIIRILASRTTERRSLLTRATWRGVAVVVLECRHPSATTIAGKRAGILHCIRPAVLQILKRSGTRLLASGVTGRIIGIGHTAAENEHAQKQRSGQSFRDGEKRIHPAPNSASNTNQPSYTAHLPQEGPGVAPGPMLLSSGAARRTPSCRSKSPSRPGPRHRRQPTRRR